MFKKRIKIKIRKATKFNRNIKRIKRALYRHIFKDRFRNRYKRNLYFMELKEEKRLLGPTGAMVDLGEVFLDKRIIKYNKRRKYRSRSVSSKININLFKVTYESLLNYHVPFGKRDGEWRPGVMLTNILMIRNQFSVFNIATIFFELRKVVNRIFKALKLRKGIAVITGRRYSWRKLFTFVFEKWLPGLFTNFWLNINELISYFYKKRCLTRRQKTRVMSLKMLNFDKKFLRKLGRKHQNLIDFTKLPTVSLSVIDNICWMRECLKEGIATIQLTDSNTEIEKIEYPLISNQSSIPFLSFINLLCKEVCYQARFWEIRKFKRNNYYKFNNRLKENDNVKDFFARSKRLIRLYKIINKRIKKARRIRRLLRIRNYIKDKISLVKKIIIRSERIQRKNKMVLKKKKKFENIVKKKNPNKKLKKYSSAKFYLKLVKKNYMIKKKRIIKQ